MNPLSLIPGSYLLPLGIGAALVGLLGMQTVRLGHQKLLTEQTQTKLAKTESAWNADKAQAANAAQQAEAQARQEEQRRNKVQQEINDEAQAKLKAANDAAVAANTASVQLRQRVAALIAANSKGASSPTPLPSSTSTDTTSDMLANVFSRLDAVAGEFARWADKAHVAGQVCEANYDALIR